MAREIILFLPGVSGCCLRTISTGKITWGRPSYILGYRNYYPQQLQFRPGVKDLTTYGPVLDFIWFSRLLNLRVPFYEHCFKVLREEIGRHQGDIDHLTKEADFYPWPYDWRKSVVDVAQRLDETVDRLIDFHQDPDLKITLICHSTAGLAAKLWWAYGNRELRENDEVPAPDFPRRRNLGRLINVGVPGQGTLKVIWDMVDGIQVVRLGRPYKPDFLFSMPALYELMPASGEGRFFTPDREPLSIDIHRAEDWFKWRLGLFTRYPHMLDDPDVRAFFERTLPQAKRVHQALAQPWPEELHEQVHLLASPKYRTVRRMPVTPQGVDLPLTKSIMEIKEWDDSADPFWVEPGDWFASFESLTAHPHHPEHMHQLECVHRHLFSDPAAKQALIDTLRGD